MNQSKITVRYAKALFELALEQNLLKAIKADMQWLLQVLEQNPLLVDLLQSPVYTANEKKTVLRATFAQQLQGLTGSFLDMLADNKREAALRNIALYFIDLAKSHFGIQSVRLSTAVALDQQQTNALISKIQQAYKAEIELETSVDPQLLGGFVLQIGDRQLDASAATQLRYLRRELTDKH